MRNEMLGDSIQSSVFSYWSKQSFSVFTFFAVWDINVSEIGACKEEKYRKAKNSRAETQDVRLQPQLLQLVVEKDGGGEQEGVEGGKEEGGRGQEEREEEKVHDHHGWRNPGEKKDVTCSFL